MSGYIGTQPVPQATQTRDSFTCTAGQTSFATSGYTPNFLDVYLNGVKLTATDYTASNGSDVVLAAGASTGDVLEVVAFTTFDVVTDTITAAGTALTLDRTGSDGTILGLKKDGSTVGSIQSRAGVVSTIVLDPRSGGGGLTGGGAALYPTDNAGSPNNGYLTLGDASSRFKDLYLSGGVYLGGTGSANKLDDYEEGTWTPTIVSTGAQPTFTYSIQKGRYHKIGNLVTISFDVIINTNTVNGTGAAIISGQPFTYASESGNPTGSCVLYGVNLDTDCMGLVMRRRTNGSGTQFFIQQQKDNANPVNLDVTAFSAGDRWTGSITFEKQ